MNIGDEVWVKAKIVGFDSNPHGSAVAVEVTGHSSSYQQLFNSKENSKLNGKLHFFIHRLDQYKTILINPPKPQGIK